MKVFWSSARLYRPQFVALSFARGGSLTGHSLVNRYLRLTATAIAAAATATATAVAAAAAAAIAAATTTAAAAATLTTTSTATTTTAKTTTLKTTSYPRVVLATSKFRLRTSKSILGSPH